MCRRKHIHIVACVFLDENQRCEGLHRDSGYLEQEVLLSESMGGRLKLDGISEGFLQVMEPASLFAKCPYYVVLYMQSVLIM